MPRVFLAPRSNETSYKNFLSTIEHGTDYSVVESFLNEEGKLRLSNLGKLFVWGNKDTSRTSFDKMQVGDTVLFYRGKKRKDETEGRIAYAGKVVHTQYSRELSLALWPPKEGEAPWSCVFFLDSLHQTDIQSRLYLNWPATSLGFSFRALCH
ncbi:hypothetical protein ACFLSW_00820 [Candidatus Bipolaricaulota bacterium]